MIFEENPAAAVSLISRAHAAHEKTTNRAPGVHGSDLIFCTKKGWLKHVMKAHRPEPTPDQMAMWLSGAGHAYILQQLGASELVRELVLKCPLGGHTHTITTTIDMVEQDMTLGPLIVEMKSTRKAYPTGDKKPELELDYYIEQLALYMLTYRKTHGRLYVLFLSGDYKAERFPLFRAYDLTLTPDELNTWGSELALRAHHMTAPGIPNPTRYAWECGYCEYASSKGGPCTIDADSKGRGGNKTGIKQSPFFVLDVVPS